MGVGVRPFQARHTRAVQGAKQQATPSDTRPLADYRRAGAVIGHPAFSTPAGSRAPRSSPPAPATFFDAAREALLIAICR